MTNPVTFNLGGVTADIPTLEAGLLELTALPGADVTTVETAQGLLAFIAPTTANPFYNQMHNQRDLQQEILRLARTNPQILSVFMRALFLQTGWHPASSPLLPGIRFVPTAADALRHLRSDHVVKRVDSRGAPVAEGPSTANKRGNVFHAAGKADGANATPAPSQTQSQDERIAVAKRDAAQDGRRISKYIKRYGIQSEASRIEIAKIATAQNGKGTSAFIQNYDIKSQDALVEIAKIAAAWNGWGTSAFIERYGIRSEASRIEIAKIAAAQNGGGTSTFIERYGIQSETARIEIAKIAAAQDGRGTWARIRNYGIKSGTALREIMRIVSVQSGWGTLRYIWNYFSLKIK